jgi:hypothetical protein
MEGTVFAFSHRHSTTVTLIRSGNSPQLRTSFSYRHMMTVTMTVTLNTGTGMREELCESCPLFQNVSEKGVFRRVVPTFIGGRGAASEQLK